VNLYAPSEVKWNEVTLTQTTDYPDSERISFRLRFRQPGAARSFAMHLRIPQWAQNASVKINDETRSVPAGRFASFKRAWRDGDTIELTLPLANRTEPIDDQHPNLVALLRGPLLFVAVDQHLKIPRAAIPEDPSQPIAAGEIKFIPFHRVRGDETYTTYFTQQS
jgi:DUF1680 family protein